MLSAVWFACYWLLACLAIIQALLLLVHTAEHVRFCRRRARHAGRRTRGDRVALIAPCKGLEPGLAENLRPLFEQDHPNYELVLVVEAGDDPAATVIGRLIASHPSVESRLICAGRATRTGQKIHNLQAAIRSLEPSVRVLAFADSDARPARSWLRTLVERLDERAKNGAVTSYRCFVPQRPTPANLLVASINRSIACLFTAKGKHLVWGGSWAIRREVFERTGISGAWQGQLSDDLVAARVLHGANLRVKFEPAAVVASPIDVGGAEAFGFLRRQFLLARIYAPRWWTALVAASLLQAAGLWLTACLFFASALAGRPDGALAGVLAALYVLHAMRGVLRARAARLWLADKGAWPSATSLFDTLLAPAATLCSLVALAASAFGRQIAWRGIVYQLDRRGRVVSLRRMLPKRRPFERTASAADVAAVA